MSGRFLDGRVALWIDELGTLGPSPVVVLHKLGTDPADLAAISGLRPSWRVIVVHQRGHGRSRPVRGGVLTSSDLAADVVRLMRRLDARSVLVGIGDSALVAAVAAAVEPERVRGLVLAPGGARIECAVDPSASRARWFAVMVDEAGGEPSAQLGFADPLYPSDRDLLWSAVPRPVGWVGAPTGAWTMSAPIDISVATTDDDLTDVVALVDAVLVGT